MDDIAIIELLRNNQQFQLTISLAGSIIMTRSLSVNSHTGQLRQDFRLRRLFCYQGVIWFDHILIKQGG